jgi:hypothetical protein
MTTDVDLTSYESKVTALHHRIAAFKDENLSWMESIIEYCNSVGSEVEDVVPLLSPFLIARITEEAVSLRLLKQSSKGAKSRVAIEFD